MKEQNTKPEILIYMSDQHSGSAMGCMGDQRARTPFLDALSKRAFVFENAYSSCPLCVPARASFLTSGLPSRASVFGNNDDFRSSEITFAHLLGIAGYHTSLIGRMHLMGEDQLHGFDVHKGKDITATYWGYGKEERKDWGEFGVGFAQKGCLEKIGTGPSPVQEYDEHIITEATKTLEEAKGTAPELFVVGTYGPHFPYVAPEELMAPYLQAEREITYPECLVHPAARGKCQHASTKTNAEVSAAYHALVEIQDMHIKRVYDAFLSHLQKTGREGIFIYTSDHGDMAGRRNLFGKQVFYDWALRIPMLLEVIGTKGHRISSAVSLMDIGPTLAEIAGAPAYPHADGKSFLSLFEKEEPDRTAVAEFFDTLEGMPIHGHMAFQDGWKYITYSHFDGDDECYHTAIDREETKNLPHAKPELQNLLLRYKKEGEKRLDAMLDAKEKAPLLARYGKLRIREKNGDTTDTLSFSGKDATPIER